MINALQKDFFFRRFHTITRKEFYNSELDIKDYFLRFEIDLWLEFTIDQLVPEMFKELQSLIDVKKIRYISINAKSLNGAIKKRLFENIPHVEFIQFRSKEPFPIPAGLFDAASSVKDIVLDNVFELPPDLLLHTNKLTNISIDGDCQLDSAIFNYAPLLRTIVLHKVHGITKDLLQGLNVRSLNLSYCKFKSIPSLVGQAERLKLRFLRIKECQFPTIQDDKILVGNPIVLALADQGSFPDLDSLEIWDNTPSLRIYNSLHYFVSSSTQNVRLIINFANDIDVSDRISLSNVNRLSIKMRNGFATMESLKDFIRQFPELRYFSFKGRIMHQGQAVEGFESAEFLDICPKIVQPVLL